MINERILDKASPIIKRLAKSRSNNGSFAYYQNVDIYQEIWCMCLEALDRYDPDIGPIENYLVSHVTNRLKNLKRDKYFRPGSDVSTSGLARVRMNLVNALPLNDCDVAEQGVFLCSASVDIEPIDYILCDETLSYITQRLPERLRESFGELICNNRIRSSLRDEIRQRVTEILIERDSDVKN